MKTARKLFRSPFLVERSKLTRLIEVAEIRFKQNGNAPNYKFELYLLGQKIIETTSIEEVFAADNSKRNRVERLILTCSSDTPKGQAPDRGLVVDFDGRSPANIEIFVRGENAAWVGEVFSATEEQVERTLQRSPLNLVSYREGASSFLFAVAALLIAIAILGTAVSSLSPAKLTNAMWLTDQDLKELEPLQSDTTLSREKAGEILFRQIRNVTRLRNQRRSLLTWVTWRSILIIAPALAILSALAYLYFRCYPAAVFLWGDAEDWYKNVLNKRRFIWSAIVVALGIGILGNLFVAALGFRG